MSADDQKLYAKNLEAVCGVMHETGFNRAQLRALLRADLRLLKKAGQAQVPKQNLIDVIRKAAATLGMQQTDPSSKPKEEPPEQQSSGKEGRSVSLPPTNGARAQPKATYKLLGEWCFTGSDGQSQDLPIKDALCEGEHGISLVQSLGEVMHYVAALRYSPAAAAIITPYPVHGARAESVKYLVRMSKEVNGVASTVQMMGWLTQLTMVMLRCLTPRLPSALGSWKELFLTSFVCRSQDMV